MTTPLSQNNPGLISKRWQALTAKQELLAGPGGIYGMTLRNAAVTPVYLNFYDVLANLVTVGGGAGSPVLSRIQVPGSTSIAIGEKIRYPDGRPMLWFSSAATICPVTTDTDAATVAGSLYVEMQVALDGPLTG